MKYSFTKQIHPTTSLLIINHIQRIPNQHLKKQTNKKFIQCIRDIIAQNRTEQNRTRMLVYKKIKTNTHTHSLKIEYRSQKPNDK